MATFPTNHFDATAGDLQGAIFNSANFSSIATDARGVIQIFNVGAERMLGYAAADVVNRITPADISDSQEVIGRAAALSVELGRTITPGFEALAFKAARGIEDIYELTYIRKDGSRLPAVVSVTALRNAQDAIIGYLLIGTDNTARKQVEEERKTELKNVEQALRQKNIELEDASRIKSEFLANMSHELRTPLNAIMGFSEVLMDGLMGELTDQQRGFVADIFGSGKRLLSLINDILDLSRVEAGKTTLDLEPVQVSSLFENCLSIVREKAADREVHLVMDAADGLGSIEADARKVKQILYNLLSNAVKFTGAGGRVTLRADRVPRGEAGQLAGPWAGRSFSLADNGFMWFLQMSITDSGAGISADELARLFQPFTQIDSGPAKKVEGTGLGLAMVRLLAELHGGTVAVQSAVGEGSCFTVWLPMREVEDAPVLEPPILDAVRTALIVEADRKSADLIRIQLEAEGFTVVHAASAAEGLAVAMRQPLSLITLDIVLPDMDGWQFLNRVKQIPALRRTPVVIISIAANGDKAFSLGASMVMQKPISRQSLSDALVDIGLMPLAEGQSLRVLVVDDDPKAVKLIAARLLGFASTVTRAFGGKHGIEVARRDLPDLIVLDLMMPEVDGFAVVEALKEHPDTARIPILVMTAKRISAEERRRLHGHVATVIEKGDFDVDRLTTEIRRAMPVRSPAN